MSQIKRAILALILAFICISTTYAQSKINNKYIFRQVNSKSGLSDNNIRNLVMMPNGLIILYSPTMLSLYDGISYSNHSFNSSFIPFKEYQIDVELVPTPDNKVILLNGDRTWYFDTQQLRFIYHDSESFGVMLSDIKSIIVDSEDNYIIYSKDGKLQSYNPTTKELLHIETPVALDGDIRMAISGDIIYILTKNGALMKYDTKLNRFTNIVSNLLDGVDKEVSKLDIEISSKGDIVVMYDYSIRLLDAETFNQTSIDSMPITEQNIFTSIAIDKKDRVWVGTSQSRLSIIDLGRCTIERPKIEILDNAHLSNEVLVTNIYIDPKGGVWIATELEGVLYYHEDIFRLNTISGRVQDENTKCMVSTEDGDILFGTPNGLHSYNPKSGEITTPYKELEDADCISLFRDSHNRIWMGTFRNGVYCIDHGKVRNYASADMPTMEASYHTRTPNFNCVRSTFEDSYGNFWISVYGGLAQLDPQSGEITLISERFPEISHIMFVRDIIQVDNLLFVSSNDGYFTFNLEHHEIESYPSSSNLYNKCNQAILDDHDAIWVATSMGLKVIVDGKERQVITTDDGLLNNNVLSVVQDKLSNIWAFTPSSASRITIIDRDKRSGVCTTSITSFTQNDGLNAGIIFPKSITTDSADNIYIGGSHGFSIINPTQLYQLPDTTKPILTNLYINNTLINVNEKFNNRVVLKSGLSSTKEIVLNHNESFISFDFSNLNYINPNHTIYRYKLENFDQKWHQINSNGAGKATYTLLKPGRYTFKVTAANNGTDWSSKGAELAINIKPPFYKSTLAYIIYFILAVIFAIYIQYLIHERNQERLLKREQEEREKVNQMKFRFFTNISHELRTPLSLILLPLKNIIRKTPVESEITPQLLTIERNASHLLSLVNHLLDFRKIEMGGEKLTLSKSNPAELIESIISDFSNTASEKRIELKISDHLNGKMYHYDVTHITKVINNLISNALKFTEEGGEIIITLNNSVEDHLIIEVSDTGVGIAKEDQALIFERFYQIKEHEVHSTGSGIGLHLVKQYVELHKGVLSVESQVGVGSTFRIELPNLSATQNEASQKEQNEKIHEEQEEQEASDKFKILIVEDNKDFREYLAMELRALNYEIYTAVDGDDGIEKAHSTHPSLIISDIMMPKSDGFTLCSTLKNDINTSHIPIILLTARTADDVRYEGYKAGADAYLSKPFSFDVLEIRISKLIEAQQDRFKQIKSQQKIQISEISMSSLDEKLMAQIVSLIEKNMSNADYSVEQLSSDVAMHRMNLYRKIQSIAGVSPSELIRSMRIKRAAQLLDQDSGLSIIEISEMVGFNTPKYFTSYFKKTYGVTPSQYIAEVKSKGKHEANE